MGKEDIKSFEDIFLDALNLFNNQKWYEAHDAFENIWNTLDGDERQIIQGILQVSVSQFHVCLVVFLPLVFVAGAAPRPPRLCRTTSLHASRECKLDRQSPAASKRGTQPV